MSRGLAPGRSSGVPNYVGVVDTLDTGVFTHLFTIPPAPPQISCRSASGTPSPLLALACRQAFGRGLTAIVHGRRRERRALKDERASADHMGGHRRRLSCVEAGPAAWSCGPTHACQGVGRRQWTARAPADGRRTCGTTLGRGTRPALSLFWTPPCAEGPPPAGRRSGPHGRIRTLPGATDTYRSWSGLAARTRSRRDLEPN